MVGEFRICAVRRFESKKSGAKLVSLEVRDNETGEMCKAVMFAADGVPALDADVVLEVKPKDLGFVHVSGPARGRESLAAGG